MLLCSLPGPVFFALVEAAVAAVSMGGAFAVDEGTVLMQDPSDCITLVFVQMISGRFLGEAPPLLLVME